MNCNRSVEFYRASERSRHRAQTAFWTVPKSASYTKNAGLNATSVHNGDDPPETYSDTVPGQSTVTPFHLPNSSSVSGDSGCPP